MIVKGDHVTHQKFGTGIVEKVDVAAGTALVRWDTHGVGRQTSQLGRDQSHVNLTSLQVDGPPPAAK